MLDSRLLGSSDWSRSVTALLVLTGVVVGALLVPVRAARALSLQVTVAQPSPIAVGNSVTLTVSLDQTIAFNGYELFASWDPTELQFSSANQLLVGGVLGFTVQAIDPAESRLSLILPSAVTGRDLFSLDFSVQSLADDGQVDFRVFAKTSGGSTGLGGTPPPILSNPQGVEVRATTAGLTVVPEPSSVVLLAAALVATAGLRRRRVV